MPRFSDRAQYTSLPGGRRGIFLVNKSVNANRFFVIDRGNSATASSYQQWQHRSFALHNKLAEADERPVLPLTGDDLKAGAEISGEKGAGFFRSHRHPVSVFPGASW